MRISDCSSDVCSSDPKRRGFDGDRIAAIKRAYRAVYVADGSLADARQKLAGMASDSADVRDFLDFIERGERPLARCEPGFGIRDWGFATDRKSTRLNSSH